MERPTNIKDKSTLLYIEHLESKIEEFKSHTKKKFYLGIQRQLDFLAEEMLSEDFQVSLKKDDSGFDQFFDMITKGEAIIKAMEKFEQQAFPSESNQGKKKVTKDDGVEEFIKNL